MKRLVLALTILASFSVSAKPLPYSIHPDKGFPDPAFSSLTKFSQADALKVCTLKSSACRELRDAPHCEYEVPSEDFGGAVPILLVVRRSVRSDGNQTCTIARETD